MTRRPRHLDPEERALWDQVARSTRAIHPPARQAPPPSADPAAPQPAAPEPGPSARGASPAPPPPAPIAPFRVGASAPLAPAAPREQPAAAPPRMDRRRFLAMTRGRSTPEARIDLHGMTLAEAHDELARFLLRCHAAERRLVLVITGKGGGRGATHEATSGVLRRHVPHWLALPPLNRIVLQTAEAHRSQGGAGALYVYLARRPLSPG